MIKDKDIEIDDVKDFEPRRKKIILGSFIAIAIIISIIIYTAQSTEEINTPTTTQKQEEIKEMKEELQKTITTSPLITTFTDVPEQTELTQELSQLELPQSVLDMTIFINNYPNTPLEKIQILMNYAVGSERGTVDEKLDREARIIYHEVTDTG